MAKTEFIKNYVDTILVSEYEQDDFRKLTDVGYKPNEDGEIEVTMLFGDGVAYDTSMNGIVMRYPTLAEVAQSDTMQRDIRKHCGDRVDDHFEQWDVALTFGKVGKYKMVADYPAWVQQGDNESKDIFSLHLKDHHVFDVFEDEFCALDDKGYLSSNEGYYELREDLSADDLHRLQAEYGILWTEWIGNHVFDERGYLKDAA